MRVKSRSMAVASISAVALLATACGGGSGGDGGDGGGGSAAGGSGGELVVNGCTPENPLVAGNTAETCGGNVLDPMTAGLIHYNSETAEPQMDIAKSIKTDDNQHFTVKLKEGYKFHNGKEVTADNFVKAWNYTAYGPNAQQGAYFFAPIQGYEDVQCTGPEEDPCAGKGKPKSKKMSGLKVVDDHTFTITTSSKVSNLKLRLGYTAFAPQPDSFFEDPEAFGQEPIGAGPYKFKSWDKNKAIKLTKFDDYSGEFAGNVENITFRIFKDYKAAYTALLAGEIDLIDSFPANAMAGGKYKEDLGDRWLSKPNSVVQWIGVNPSVSPKLDDVKVRRAISMAINRDQIIKNIFNNTRQAATGLVSPVVNGYKEGACQGYCKYDPEKAKKTLKEAGGWPGGELTITYNGDGGHAKWTEAACNSITNTLDIKCVATPTIDFKTFLTKLGKEEIKGLWRMGWIMDYPSIENYLAPIYSKGAASNYYGYSNPEFNKTLKKAAAAQSQDKAIKLYREAHKMVLSDMIAIPLWYGKTMLGWSEDITNVKATPFGNPDLAAIKMK